MLRGKHFITTQDWDLEELETILDISLYLKRKYALNESHRYLEGKTMFMIFFDPSTRTRNSFEAGMTQLGGHAHDLSPEKLQVLHGETAEATAKVLSRYGDCIGIRHCLYGVGNKYIIEVARHSKIPVVNMQCDIYHPCQAMADILTIIEKLRGKLGGKKAVISWAYTQSYTKPMSVPQSLLLLLPRFGIDVTLAHPKEFKLMPSIMKVALKNAKEAGVKIITTDSMQDAFASADIVYPKSWGCFETTNNSKRMMQISKKYKNWICDEALMDLTNKHSIYMHCLPADIGYEVTESVIKGKHSVVDDEAENRLHVQKALLSLIIGGR
jgi:ornithine carbamoyltransferase